MLLQLSGYEKSCTHRSLAAEMERAATLMMAVPSPWRIWQYVGGYYLSCCTGSALCTAAYISW
jgi:hypothetical protein